MREGFGVLANGETVERLEIGNDTLRISALTHGAILQSIRLKDVPFSLCLGFGSLPDYLASTGCIGAIVGRVANRIGDARATIDGTPHSFDPNENGRHTLHSGSSNLANQNWWLEKQTDTALRLTTRSHHGDSGFPGNLDVSVDYIISDNATLDIVLEAQTDAPTLCNLAPHPYFNLNGKHDARLQGLFVDAKAITETDDQKIPTGALAPVAGTPWDHQPEKPIIQSGAAYDLNYCVGKQRTRLRPVARLVGYDSGIAMTIETTEPGLQVYDGSGLATPYAGIALEPQCWPDAPNHPNFPSILLRPDEVSRQVTRLSFSRL